MNEVDLLELLITPDCDVLVGSHPANSELLVSQLLLLSMSKLHWIEFFEVSPDLIG